MSEIIPHNILSQVAVWMIISIMGWVGWNTHQTAVSVAVMAEQLEQQTKRLDQHDDRFENVTSRVRQNERDRHNHE